MSEADRQYVELRKKEEILKMQLSDVESEIAKVSDQIRFERFQIRVGSVVKVKNDLFKVSSLRVDVWRDPYDRPWCMGHPKKKDGSFGTAERHLWRDWEVVEP